MTEDIVFTEFYKENSSQIYHYAMWLLNDRQLAEDVTQAVFCAALVKGIAEQPISKAWLRTAARYEISNMGKKKENHQQSIEDLEIPFYDLDYGKLELNMTLQSFLSELECEIVSLHQEGLTHKEIALKLGISDGALRVRVHRLKNKIKQNYTCLLLLCFVLGIGGNGS